MRSGRRLTIPPVASLGLPLAVAVTLGLAGCSDSPVQQAQKTAAAPTTAATQNGQDGGSNDSDGDAAAQLNEAAGQATDAAKDAAARATDAAGQAQDSARSAAAEASKAAGPAIDRAREQIDLNTASRADIEAALRERGVPNPQRWAAELDRIPDVDAVEVEARVRQELSRFNVDDQTVQQILDTIRR